MHGRLVSVILSKTFNSNRRIGQVIAQDLGNTLHYCPQVIYLHCWEQHQIWKAESTVAHCVTGRCLAVDRNIAVHMQMLSGEGVPIQIIESVTSEAKMFKHALGGLSNMKFRPGRVTNVIFLRFLL